MINLFDNILTQDLKLDQKVTQLLLNGGTIVESRVGINRQNKTHFVGLIRMPKGKFIKDTREGELYENNSFEYAIIENLWHEDKYESKDLKEAYNDVVIIQKHVKEDIRVMRNLIRDRYYESRHLIK
jgi:hypothetical protein